MKQNRIESPHEVSEDQISKHINAGERVIVQFSKSGYSAQQLAMLNELAKRHGRNFEIRFYGHYSEIFDASVLRLIPNAQSVSIDCLMQASNLDALSLLHNLVELSLGVFELDNPDILSLCNIPTLKALSLGGAKKCNIDFSHLSKCVSLEQIHTTGHTKNISTFCDLPLLQSLSLSSIKRNEDIGFVSRIPRLKTLRLILGGRTSIAQVNSAQLQELDIIRVQGLEDVGDIGRFENLERLLIEDQIRLTGIKVGPNPRLVDMKVLNCKTLEVISGFGCLKALSSLRIYKTAIDYERFIAGSIPDSLGTFAFYTGKNKRDSEIRQELDRKGFHEFARQ